MASDAMKDFEGTIKVISPQNFGFIEDIFVEPKIIEESKLTDGQPHTLPSRSSLR